MAKKPGRGSDQFVVRLPDGMRDQIKAAADRKGTSMNQEILNVLENEFPSPPDFDEVRKKIEALIALDFYLDEGASRQRLNDYLYDVIGRIGLLNNMNGYNEKKTNLVWLSDESKKGVELASSREGIPFDNLVAEAISYGLMAIEIGRDNFFGFYHRNKPSKR